MQAHSQQHVPERNDQKVRVSYTLPLIVNNNASLHTLTNNSLHALKAVNCPPVLFQHYGKLVRLRRYEGNVELEPANVDILRGHVDRAARHIRRSKPYHEQAGYIVEMPLLETARDIISLDSYPEEVFPVIRGVVNYPYFTKTGRLVVTPGYDPESGRFYNPDPGFVLPPIPASPTREEVGQAYKLLFSEYLVDFPFCTSADGATAVVTMMLPFVRLMIQGPTPLILLEASSPGTGKSLLANCIAIPTLGKPLDVTPQRKGDEEWRKTITAAAINPSPFVLLDNLTGNLDSPALAAALTTDTWTDRLLGESRMLRLTISNGWLATANNLELSQDIYRRTVPIRLDAKMESPETRDVTKFKHPRLVQWGQDHRAELVKAILTIINFWIAQGQPKGTVTMGSYESWAEVLGGIIGCAGFKGFLANREELRIAANSDLEEFGQFVLAWVNKFPPGKRRADELFPLLQDQPDLLPYVMSSETEHGRKARFGRYMVKKRDRVFKGMQLKILPGTDKSGRRFYDLIDIYPADDAENGQAPDPSAEPMWPKRRFEAEYEEPNPDLDEISNA